MRIRAIALWSVVVLVATVGVAWYWLLHTESGARWLVARAQAAAQGALQLASVRGDLASGVTATAISFEAGGTGVTAAELTIAVDVDLLPPGLEIVTAALHTVDVRIGPSDQPDDEPRDIESMLRKLALPIPIRVNGMSVDDVGGSSDLGQELTLESWNVQYADSDMNGHVAFDVRGEKWRFWSTQLLPAELAGDWTVQVIDDQGKVLKSGTLHYAPAGPTG